MGGEEEKDSEISMVFTLTGEGVSMKPLQTFKVFVDLATVMIPIDL